MADKRTKAENFLRHLEPLQGALEAYCRRSLRDRNAVADVLQSAVGNAFRDFHLYVEGSNFRAWIFRYVHLEIQNCNRKHGRIQAAELQEDDSVAKDSWDAILDEPLLNVLLDAPEIVLERCDAALSQAIQELSLEDQEVFLLYVVGEFKYREIAEILHIPIGTVMSRLARARVRLRQRLVEYGEEHGLLRREET